jgi:hypothetical protein
VEVIKNRRTCPSRESISMLNAKSEIPIKPENPPGRPQQIIMSVKVAVTPKRAMLLINGAL